MIQAPRRQSSESTTAEPGIASLEWPIPPTPQRGHGVDVCPGVHWIRMPMPWALDHINIWRIDDDGGWAIVDTGMRDTEAKQTWRELLANAPAGKPLTRVLVTHMHGDHAGMAGWLARKLGVRLWMTRAEYLSCRMLVADASREAPPDAIAFCRRAGWSEAPIDKYRARFGAFGKYIEPLPDSYRRLRDGEEVRIGEHAWRVVVGMGHSPEHACFYCPDLSLLISGDQVLPSISSNVSVHFEEPDADPMADWYDSLAKIKREVPDDVLVLPAHGDCFRGLHARVDALKREQDEAVARLRLVLDAPKRVVDIMGVLFGRPIDEADLFLLSLATGEGLAWLNYLSNRGEIRREIDADGVAWFKLV